MAKIIVTDDIAEFFIPSNRKPIIVNGTLYRSLAEASRSEKGSTRYAMKLMKRHNLKKLTVLGTTYQIPEPVRQLADDENKSATSS